MGLDQQSQEDNKILAATLFGNFGSSMQDPTTTQNLINVDYNTTFLLNKHINKILGNETNTT